MKWNKDVYGNIFVRKRKLVNELKKVQKILEFRSSHSLLKWGSELKFDIEEALAHEELLWFQKSRVD